MLNTLSTSPPKSACPGVSIILIRVFFHKTEVGFAKIVIPLSFSKSPESITRSEISLLSLNIPACIIIESMSVVLP